MKWWVGQAEAMHSYYCEVGEDSIIWFICDSGVVREDKSISNSYMRFRSILGRRGG